MFAQICHWLTGTTPGLIFTLFLCMAVGYGIGKIKFGPITLGATVGTLFVAVAIAMMVGNTAAFTPPDALSSVFLSLFIFALGYDVGPAFVRSLKRSGLRLIGLALAFAVFSFCTGALCYFVFNLSSGELVGLFAGSTTQSSILGAAQTTMAAQGITGDALNAINTQMTVCFALGYLISYAGCVILIKGLLPNILGCKGVAGLRDEVKKSTAKLNYKGDAATDSVIPAIRLRSFVVKTAENLTVGALQGQFDERIQVEALRRGENDACVPIEFDNSTLLCAGDIVSLLGDLDHLLALGPDHFAEVTDSKYQKLSIAKEKLVVTKAFSLDAASDVFAQHVIPVKASRNGAALTELTQFQHGDVVTIMGTPKSVQRIAKEYGYPVNNSDESDVSYLSIGVAVGILVGILTITIAGIPLSFGTSGGILFLGIFCGWYNNKRPSAGYVSPGARWLMKSIGLSLFVACLGLSSGASFLSALQSMGINVLFAIILMSFVPHIATVLFGKYVLKLSPVEALGGTCGCGTNTAALNGLIEETDSSIFAVSYTPAYAAANIVLTFLGIVSMILFH